MDASEPPPLSIALFPGRVPRQLGSSDIGVVDPQVTELIVPPLIVPKVFPPFRVPSVFVPLIVFSVVLRLMPVLNVIQLLVLILEADKGALKRIEGDTELTSAGTTI